MSEEEREHISEEQEDIPINLSDYLLVLAKQKKLIISITLPVAIIAIIISILSSISFYQAETSILIFQEKKVSRTSKLMSQLGLYSSGSENLFSNKRLLVEIIKSRTFSNIIIDRFNLRGVYAADDADHARIELFKHVKIVPDFTNPEQFRANLSNTSPLMRIIVKDQSSQRAADIANTIVKELNVFINNSAISDASQKRLFFERHLRQASDSLIKVEDDMKAFQEKTGIMSVGGQMNITVNKFAPELLLEYKRIVRQLKYNETLYEIMVKQYEAAKLDESKNTTSIQVIDKAIPPFEPKRMRTWGKKKIILSTLLALLFSCFLALALEYYKRPSEEHSARSRKS